MTLSKLKHARGSIENLRLALIGPSPEDIGAALSGLEEAANFLEELERELREGTCPPHEVRREIELLKEELQISAGLLYQGFTFCRRWAKMLGATPGYTPTGETANTVFGGSLSLQG